MVLSDCLVDRTRYRVPTFQGGDLLISVEEGAVYINGAPMKIEKRNRMTTSGVVHVISEVLLPLV